MEKLSGFNLFVTIKPTIAGIIQSSVYHRTNRASKKPIVGVEEGYCEGVDLRIHGRAEPEMLGGVD